MNDPLKQQQQQEGGTESPSAYASAESSPSQSMATSLSMHSIPNGAANQEDEFVLVSRTAAAMQSSQSMNSFGGHHAPPSPTQYVNLTSIPSSMSVSGIDTLAKLEELNMQAFTSLPPIKSSPETVKEVIERVVKAEVEKQLSPKQPSSSPQQQQTSPNSYKSSSVFSVLGRIFKSSSKNNEDKSKAAANLSPVSSASSSSPNPENSPFKLLEPSEQSNKQQHASPKCEEPVNSDVKEAAAMLFPAGGDTTSIEKLVQLNDERGELDPILSPPRHHAPKPEPSISPAAVSSSENMKVPASSQEFCMDLNLNIAASAALAVAAPVAICESSAGGSKSNKSSPHHQCASNGNDHQRFTKNASTSSIHNDLKAILEESQLSATGGEGKKTESGSATSPSSTSKSVKKRSSKSQAAATAAAGGASTDEGTKKPQDAPKPQREKKHRNKHSKSSEKKSPAATESLVESKMNVLELLMKTAAAAMAEATKPPTSKRGPHRYSREFLLQIRDERTKLIDNICPDIFRAHSYCISGSYWDPEKYFNAMLHGERLYDFVNNNHVTSNKLVSSYGPKSLPHTQQQLQPQRASHHHLHNNSYHSKFDNNRRWARRNPAQEMRSNGLNPLVNTNKSGSWSHPNLSEVNQALSDKYLLDLVKNTSSANMSAGQSPRHAGVDLMGMLNKKNTNNLDEKSIKPMQPRHSPMILTAQELEFSQLFSPAAAAVRKQQQQQQPNRTPERNQATTSGSSPASSRSSNLSPSSLSSGGAGNNGVNNSDDMDGGDNNISDAYKQLVRNLSNHPLSSAPHVPKSSSSSVSAVDQLFNSAAPKRDEKQQQEAVIKQLLNLSTTSNEEASTSRSNGGKQYYNRFGSKPKSYGPRKSPGSGHIDNLLRMKPAAAASGSNEHFSMILEKLMPTLSGHISPSGTDAAAANNTKSDDIMKWFRSAPSSDHRL